MEDKKVYIIITKGKQNKFVNHYGMLVTDGKDYNYVYQCTKYLKNKNGGCVVKVKYEDFLHPDGASGGYRDPIYFIKTELTEEEVEARACEMYNNKYTNLIFNCSDFTRRITKLTPFYTQKNLLIGAIAVTVFLIALNWKR